MSTKKITKKAFLAAAKKGWKKLGYSHMFFFETANGEPCDAKDAVACCAVGAVAYATKRPAAAVWNELGALYPDVSNASDFAGSKEAALRAISKLKWSA